MNDIRYVRSVDRAIDALELIARTGPRGLSEMAEKMSMPKSTLLNILRTLARRRVIEHDAQAQSYRLGPLLAALADRARDEADLPRVARPHLEALARITGETTGLAIPDGNSILFVEKVESPQPIRYTAQIGTRRPLHSTSGGKLTLALRSSDQWDAYVKQVGLQQYTPRTIVDPTRLRQELQQIALQGYAVNDGELLADLVGVSVPVFRGKGGPYVAAMVVTGPAFRMRPHLPTVLAQAQEQAAALTTDLWHFRPAA